MATEKNYPEFWCEMTLGGKKYLVVAATKSTTDEGTTTFDFTRPPSVFPSVEDTPDPEVYSDGEKLNLEVGDGYAAYALEGEALSTWLTEHGKEAAELLVKAYQEKRAYQEARSARRAEQTVARTLVVATALTKLGHSPKQKPEQEKP